MTKIEIENRDQHNHFVDGLDAEIDPDGTVSITVYGAMSDETATVRLAPAKLIELRDFLTAVLAEAETDELLVVLRAGDA